MLRTVSLFSGSGGLDLGFSQSGFPIIWAVDNFADAVHTYAENLGNHIVKANLEDIPSSKIPECELVIGGFPCQGFSIANMKRHPGDGRNKMYMQFLRVVADKRPMLFLAENVKGILSLARGGVFDQILRDFRANGYRIVHCVLNAADFGVPQRRERVFILGLREDLTFSHVHFPPTPTHGRAQASQSLFQLRPWRSVGDALSGLPEPHEQHTLFNHVASNYKLRFNGYLGHRRVDPEMPSPTVTARGDDRGGVVILHHPGNHRRLTVREAALIQSFPIDFEFHGTKTSAYRQVANAVPPLLAMKIADAIKLTIEELTPQFALKDAVITKR